ncbi:hypothetical protein [Pandoraea captiosa]|jgi:hypothetical protein|uniref:hypothetical protein n=1 Tax=Pandoraea captiosa TaxID=2508302 RepID=UPI001241BE37|nr:hypothetical protein [Pandoraea captiosa]
MDHSRARCSALRYFDRTTTPSGVLGVALLCLMASSQAGTSATQFQVAMTLVERCEVRTGGARDTPSVSCSPGVNKTVVLPPDAQPEPALPQTSQPVPKDRQEPSTQTVTVVF